jgi:cytochrome c-type biogenesis protein
VTFAEVAVSGPLLAGVAVAALAGLVSFFAPCMLPLVPGYLSYITGLTGRDLAAAAPDPVAGPVSSIAGPATATRTRPTRRARRRAVAGSVLFVVGFTVVFTLLAYAAGQLGRALLVYARPIEVVVGGLTIVWGVGFAGVPVPGLHRTWRVTRRPKAGLAGAPVLGATFALSWTPCLSPTLTAVLGLAAVQGSAGRGTVLAAAYSLGMGLPFVGFGFGYGRLLRLASVLRRHGDWVARAGGVLLVAVGLALITGAWTVFINWLRVTVGPGQIGI